MCSGRMAAWRKLKSNNACTPSCPGQQRCAGGERFRLENDGDGFWAQIAIEIKNGRIERALSIPMILEGAIAIDLGLPAEGGL